MFKKRVIDERKKLWLFLKGDTVQFDVYQSEYRGHDISGNGFLVGMSGGLCPWRMIIKYQGIEYLVNANITDNVNPRMVLFEKRHKSLSKW